MAGRKKSESYVSKGITHSLKFTSRMSIKVNDTFYTIEACEERWFPEEGVDIDKERELLWEDVNGQCEDQIELIYKTIKK